MRLNRFRLSAFQRRAPLAAVSALIIAATLSPRVARAQPAPIASRVEYVAIDSGVVRNNGRAEAIAWATLIEVPEAIWLRLSFRTAILGEDPHDQSSSTLVITSLKDGAVQPLNAVTIRQWRNSSAYFNGERLLLELWAAPNGRGNRIVIEEVTVGVTPVAEESICDLIDDRLPSDDVRVGRAMPIGCTAWLFNDENHCGLTAGHCSTSFSVLEFNVPLSNGDRSLNHPPPEDQYAVDFASMWTNGGQGLGNDWAYFGLFPNSGTGLTAYEAQGAAFVLSDAPPSVNGQDIRITGYGTTSPPVPNQWNQAQKTHAGPYFSYTTGPNNSTVRYRTDTTGGNSGSPVINEENGEAIGIHTHAGCDSSPDSANHGTGSDHPAFRIALDNPRGVCLSTLAFSYPNGKPSLINPQGGTTMRVEVEPIGQITPQPNTGRLYYEINDGFVEIPMKQVSDNVYDAVFPSARCGTSMRYYVSAETTDGIAYYDPHQPPATLYLTFSADSLVVNFADDFERERGWTVENQNLSSGAWVRATPAGGGQTGDPLDDYDGSGQCYVTGNRVNEEVNGGPTRLISPTIDAAALVEPTLAYACWFSTDGSDRLLVEISNDDGQSWTLIDSVLDGPGWSEKTVRIADFLEPTSQMRVRFSTADTRRDSITEAAIDAVRLLSVLCDCDPCDMNCDGEINAFDIDSLLDLLFGGGTPCAACTGDVNGDGGIDAFDIEPFLECLFP